MSRNTPRAIAQPIVIALVAATQALPVATQVQLEEVIVTVQKRQQALQDMPISVAVLTDAQVFLRVTLVTHLRIFRRSAFKPHWPQQA